MSQFGSFHFVALSHIFSFRFVFRMLLKCFDDMFCLPAVSPCLTSNVSLVTIVLRAVYTIKLKCFDEQMICIVWYLFSSRYDTYIYIYISYTYISQILTQKKKHCQYMFMYVHVAWCGIILHHLNVTSFCIISLKR